MTDFLATPRSAVALIILASTVACACAGDKVIFSRGATNVAAPARPSQINIPAGAEEFRGLSGGHPDLATPYVPPPPIRSEKKKERRTVFDDPKLFSDPMKDQKDGDRGDDDSDSGLGPSKEKRDKDAASKLLTDRFGKPTEDRALSPIRQFNWNPDFEESGDREKDSSKRDKNRDQNNGVFSSKWNDAYRSSPLRMMQEEPGARSMAGVLNFNNDSKRDRDEQKEQIERRVEFEKLLNPGFAPLGTRDPSAFAGAASPLDFTRPAAAPALTPVPAPVAPGRGLMPAMPAFGDQQRGFRGASFDDLNGSAFGSPVARPVAPAQLGETAGRAPLMNQPTFQQFPARRF